jgi:hypothetical protein
VSVGCNGCVTTAVVAGNISWSSSPGLIYIYMTHTFLSQMAGHNMDLAADERPLFLASGSLLVTDDLSPTPALSLKSVMLKMTCL